MPRNQDIDSNWQSSTRGERAWKEATDEVAARNVDARKAGRAEREEYERDRAEKRHSVDEKRRADLLKRPR
jgi:hypothetical protein